MLTAKVVKGDTNSYTFAQYVRTSFWQMKSYLGTTFLVNVFKFIFLLEDFSLQLLLNTVCCAPDGSSKPHDDGANWGELRHGLVEGGCKLAHHRADAIHPDVHQARALLFKQLQDRYKQNWESEKFYHFIWQKFGTDGAKLKHSPTHSVMATSLM